uniref:Fibronectin type III domain-containing protein n=1 Tax=Candidatus Kentrum sp. UNK TaxID=2126344 RepID=A0A451A1A6_9GAMM|nr:MAG: Fibronectin type III domain-containing protein [Candidatus Kentron sp. UNK]VFK70112.1 MAG: Fibronectin type III domain-containing protein [Candidatus Kentron sp. UNK]
MAQFPRDETGILGLAQEIADGLAANRSTYPAPPVSVKELEAATEDCNAAHDAVQAAKAALEQAVSANQLAFDALEEKMKKELRYAENTVDQDSAKLKLIGWGGRKPATPLTPPGQAGNLVIRSQGEGTIDLAWEKPAAGGKVAAYKMKCRPRVIEGATGAVWTNADTAMKTKITLAGQIQGKELEYCVVAVNKAGEGVASNTVTAVL